MSPSLRDIVQEFMEDYTCTRFLDACASYGVLSIEDLCSLTNQQIEMIFSFHGQDVCAFARVARALAIKTLDFCVVSDGPDWKRRRLDGSKKSDADTIEVAWAVTVSMLGDDSDTDAETLILGALQHDDDSDSDSDVPCTQFHPVSLVPFSADDDCLSELSSYDYANDDDADLDEMVVGSLGTQLWNS